MKRSEALKIIDKTYEQFCKDWMSLDITNDEQLNNFKRLDDRILTALEEAGMNPPYYAPDDVGLVWGDEKTGEPNGVKIMVSKWEPEDET